MGDVILHSFSEVGTGPPTIKCLELWDVAGSHNYQMTRKFFYNDMNGIILVHDLNNKMSLSNLRAWLREVVGSTFEGVQTVEAHDNSVNHDSSLLYGSTRYGICASITNTSGRYEIQPGKTEQTRRGAPPLRRLR